LFLRRNMSKPALIRLRPDFEFFRTRDDTPGNVSSTFC